MLTSLGIIKDIENRNYTIFVPDDDTFNRFTEKMFELNKVETNIDSLRKRKRRDLRNSVSSKELILNHVVEGINLINDISGPMNLKR